MHVSTVGGMIDWSQAARRSGKSVGFVPTMGALHEGHASLIRRAKSENDLAVVSVFVNPIQFGPEEDFARYPRDLDADAETIAAAGGDVLFTTTPEEMYPEGFSTYVVPGGLADRWEGASRSRHFRGVATVVLKLLQIVRPRRAYFGRKDAQQLAIVERMVRDFHLDLEVIPCPIVREADGLALSSRNVYLSPAQRREALALSRALRAADRAFRAGERSGPRILDAARAELEKADGVDLDYLVLVEPDTWREYGGKIDRGLVLVAARVGSTRLIDNWLLGEEG